MADGKWWGAENLKQWLLVPIHPSFVDKTGAKRHWRRTQKPKPKYSRRFLVRLWQIQDLPHNRLPIALLYCQPLSKSCPSRQTTHHPARHFAMFQSGQNQSDERTAWDGKNRDVCDRNSRYAQFLNEQPAEATKISLSLLWHQLQSSSYFRRP